MRGLKTILDRVDDCGRFPKGCAPIDVYELRSCYDRVRDGGAFYTVIKNVADICDKCGLVVVVDGIGWKIGRVR